MAAVTTRFATCPDAPHGAHYWVGPFYGSPAHGHHCGPAKCRYCGVALTEAVTIPICPECGLDTPAHKPKCKTGRAA